MLGNTGGYDVPYDSLISPSSLPAKWGNGPSYYGLAAFTGGARGRASKLRGRGGRIHNSERKALQKKALWPKAEQHPHQETPCGWGSRNSPFREPTLSLDLVHLRGAVLHVADVGVLARDAKVLLDVVTS